MPLERCCHLLEQLTHALCIGTQRRRLAARFLREEEVEIDRLLERTDDALRAGRDRVQAAFGQIDARAAQQERDQDHDADEQHGEREQRAGPVGLLGAGRHVQSAFFMSSTIAFAVSQTAITNCEIQQVAHVDHALGDGTEMREERQRGDRVDYRLRRPALEQAEHEREPGQQEQEADRDA